ncbi:MAG: hypothetical protein ACRCX2_37955 [Paraclostridium sp.]
MLENYMTMNAILKSKNGLNDFGEPSYIEKNIACRLVDKFKEITNDKGEKVVSSGVIQTIEDVKVGDLINGRRIVAITSMTSLDGVIGYKGYLL